MLLIDIQSHDTLLGKDSTSQNPSGLSSLWSVFPQSILTLALTSDLWLWFMLMWLHTPTEDVFRESHDHVWVSWWMFTFVDYVDAALADCGHVTAQVRSSTCCPNWELQLHFTFLQCGISTVTTVIWLLLGKVLLPQRLLLLLLLLSCHVQTPLSSRTSAAEEETRRQGK